MLKRLLMAPAHAWHYSQRYPLEAFFLSGICLLFAWGGRIFLSIIAFALMGGAISTLLGNQK